MHRFWAILCIGISSTWVGVASAQVIPEPGPVPAICIPTSMPDPRTWRTTGSGPFLFQIPNRFRQQPIRDIDSMRSAWRTTDGTELITDYGVYTGPFSSRKRELGARMVQCQEARGARVPEIVIYQTTDAQYAAGLYWIEPGGRSIPGGGGTARHTALWMRGLSPREEDLGLLLAILYSVRLHLPAAPLNNALHMNEGPRILGLPRGQLAPEQFGAWPNTALQLTISWHDFR